MRIPAQFSQKDIQVISLAFFATEGNACGAKQDKVPRMRERLPRGMARVKQSMFLAKRAEKKR